MKTIYQLPIIALLILGFSSSATSQPTIVEFEPTLELVKGATTKVTLADFNLDLERIPKEKQLEFLSNPERVERLLARLAQMKLMENGARTSGMDKDPKVQARLQAIISKELANLYLEQLFNSIRVPNLETRAKELYELNKNRFLVEATTHVAHILIDTKKRTKEEALTRANMIRQKALSPEADFQKLATEYSEDPSVDQNKGDLGPQVRRALVKPFADAAFSMTQPGQISDPVETEFGLHIIQLKDNKPTRIRTYDEVRTGLLNDAEREYRGAELRRLIENKEKQENAALILENISKILPKTDIKSVLDKAHAAAEKAGQITTPKKP